jgi:beta-lactamase regulating signal transducer with metallopeptidase domain
MILPQLQTVAQIAIGRFLNSLPEGILIALFAGMMLRVLPRQNSRTRFAVWFVALLAVAGLPLIGGILIGCTLIGRMTIGGIAGGHTLLATGGMRPAITLPGGWGLCLFLAWVLAAFVAMLRLVIGLWRLRALRMSSVAIDGIEHDPSIRRTLTDFSAARSVTLATSERISVPAAIGFFKPMIVVPAWALRELTPAELNIVLLHEFAHVRRGDAWTNLLQKTVRAVFLFNPAVWWIENKLSLEREMACDDQVLAQTNNPRGYAQCLIALLEKSVARRGWTMAQALVRRSREASLRLSQILDVGRPNSKRIYKPALGLVAVFSLFCLMVVPRAPQFVAFEANRPANKVNDAPSPAVAQAQFPSAVVIPAAMRTASISPVDGASKRAAARVVGHLHESQRVAPPVVAVRWISEATHNGARILTDEVNPAVVPISETLLIIRTTERVGPNSWVWSVGVWRVTVLNLTRDEAGKVPAAKKT